jgi:carbon-monoxide dehydrogenase large subunit
MAEIGARSIGARVLRTEDPRILTGRGQYLDDINVPGMLYGAFKRSTVPHGRIISVDATAARALPGVIAVYTGEDIKAFTNPVSGGQALGMVGIPGLNAPQVYSLCTDKVRYVGDPIALVVAEDRYIAEDAVELIEEDIEILDAVVTYEQALDPTRPPLYDEFDTNVAMSGEAKVGDPDGAFAKADRVVEASIWVHRHQPVPMECRGVLSMFDKESGQLTIHYSTQSPHMPRMLLPIQINIPMEKIRVLAADVGGGFGLKNGVARDEVAVIAASVQLGRPIKWAEDRLEHLATGGQAREEGADIQAAVTNDGVLLGFRMQAKGNTGAYPADPFNGSFMAGSTSSAFQGPCAHLEGYEAKTISVFSNKATYVSYRGPWATGDFLRERMLDVIAHELGIDPLEVRRRNYCRRDEEPLTMLTGQPYARVTTQESVEQAAKLVDWDGFKARQEAARTSGRYLGLGMASYLEAAPGPRGPQRDGVSMMLGTEVTHVSVDDDGKVVVVTRQQPHGQGHETTLTQVAADMMGVKLEDVKVVFGDTDVTPMALIGTGGSRAATMANGAVLHASRQLKEKALSLAAELLEANAADLDITDSVISVKGSPTVQLSLGDLVRRVRDEASKLPEGTDTDLNVTYEFDGGESGWSGGTHVAEVEVDPETGMVEIKRYVVVEDCGMPVNPAIVEGQVRGGVAQGIGAVLLEHSAYGEDGQFLASTFMDYLMPTTTTVPTIEIHHVESHISDETDFRGVGEGGMIVAPACLTNAIEDAIYSLGGRVREQHLPPQRILELIGTVSG